MDFATARVALRCAIAAACCWQLVDVNGDVDGERETAGDGVLSVLCIPRGGFLVSLFATVGAKSIFLVFLWLTSIRQRWVDLQMLGSGGRCLLDVVEIFEVRGVEL